MTEVSNRQIRDIKNLLPAVYKYTIKTNPCPKHKVLKKFHPMHLHDDINPSLHSRSYSIIGLNPSSQIQPMRTCFVGDIIVVLLCDRVLVTSVSNADDRSSDILNQLSSTSTGDSPNSNELFGEFFDSPNTSRLFEKGISVDTNGKNVTGNRCCSSNVNRGLCGETVIRD